MSGCGWVLLTRGPPDFGLSSAIEMAFSGRMFIRIEMKPDGNWLAPPAAFGAEHRAGLGCSSLPARPGLHKCLLSAGFHPPPRFAQPKLRVSATCHTYSMDHTEAYPALHNGPTSPNNVWKISGGFHFAMLPAPCAGMLVLMPARHFCSWRPTGYGTIHSFDH